MSRSFRIRHEHNRTLKETVLRRRRGRFEDRWALRSVDLDISPGECVGVVGQNGSGKSTLLKLVAGILYAQTGTVEVSGSVASMLEPGSGFHPDFTGRENVYMNAAIHGLSERGVDERFDDIMRFAEIEDFIDMPFKTYSSGMQMRLAFAVASHVDADILLIDEVLAVGDESFQRKCLGRIFEFRRRGGTLLLVSHDAASIQRVCSRAVLVWDGAIVEDAPPARTLSSYHRRMASTDSSTDGAGQPLTDPDQWGNGRIRLTEIALVEGGRPTTNVLSGSDLEIQFTATATNAVDDPVFGFAIKTPDGLICFGSNTDLDGVTTGRFFGRRRIALRITDVPVHEGRYVVQLAAVSADQSEVYHWIENQCEFSVVPSRAGVGFIRMSTSWSINPDAQPATSSLHNAAP